MADSTITLTTGLVMIALFTVAIIGFSLGFADDNDAAISIADDPEISSLNTNTQDNLSTFKDEAADTYQSIIETTVEPGSDVVQSSSSFVITTSNVFGVAKNMIYIGYGKIFGFGGDFGVFISVFFGLILFMIALFVIKTWRGNP